MDALRNIMLVEVKQKAQREARHLAGEFARAAARDREAIFAALEFEQWLAAGCADCLAGSGLTPANRP